MWALYIKYALNYTLNGILCFKVISLKQQFDKTFENK